MKEIICLGCPNGCHIECTKKKDGEVEIAGEKCKRGVEYARQELLDPRRMVTAVVRTDSEAAPFLPVKTREALPKNLIDDLLKAIYAAKVNLPVRAGDVLFENFRGSGVDVVLSRSAA
jgi:CxxC motif-containing protein